LLYLAKEYVEAEQVAPYIDKVKTAIDQLKHRTPSVVAMPKSGDTRIIAVSKPMLSALELARHVAPTNMTILLTGQTGTGKDLLARYIHEYSGRTGRFISQNYAALPLSLAESELFGHRRGAFTGAAGDKLGLIEAADSGTFFLNEIADAPMELQAKLLEVLETKMIRRLGDTNDRKVDVRIIAATNHDLAKAVRENRFRADLYHRLNEININLPPLAEREGDIAELTQRFLVESGMTSPNGHTKQLEQLTALLSSHNWPGNVRELESTVKRLWLVCRGDLSRMTQVAADELSDCVNAELAEVLAECDGNKSKAARVLGVTEGTIRRRLKQLD
jgi:transcriptional regulator with PAS, ATPase and Fis domain